MTTPRTPGSSLPPTPRAFPSRSPVRFFHRLGRVRVALIIPLPSLPTAQVGCGRASPRISFARTSDRGPRRRSRPPSHLRRRASLRSRVPPPARPRSPRTSPRFLAIRSRHSRVSPSTPTVSSSPSPCSRVSESSTRASPNVSDGNAPGGRRGARAPSSSNETPSAVGAETDATTTTIVEIERERTLHIVGVEGSVASRVGGRSSPRRHLHQTVLRPLVDVPEDVPEDVPKTSPKTKTSPSPSVFTSDGLGGPHPRAAPSPRPSASESDGSSAGSKRLGPKPRCRLQPRSAREGDARGRRRRRRSRGGALRRGGPAGAGVRSRMARRRDARRGGGRVRGASAWRSDANGVPNGAGRKIAARERRRRTNVGWRRMRRADARGEMRTRRGDSPTAPRVRRGARARGQERGRSSRQERGRRVARSERRVARSERRVASLRASFRFRPASAVPDAAPVLYRLSQVVGRQRGRRGEEESLLLRALRALDAAAEADQDGNRTDDAQIRYRLLCSLHASRAALSDDAREDPRHRRRRDEDAERFATAALDVAERAFGPWHPHVADALYRWATCLNRAGSPTRRRWRRSNARGGCRRRSGASGTRRLDASCARSRRRTNARETFNAPRGSIASGGGVPRWAAREVADGDGDGTGTGTETISRAGSRSRVEWTPKNAKRESIARARRRRRSISRFRGVTSRERRGDVRRGAERTLRGDLSRRADGGVRDVRDVSRALRRARASDAM